MNGLPSISDKDERMIDLGKSDVFNSITNNNVKLLLFSEFQPFSDPEINKRNTLVRVWEFGHL